MLDIVITGRHDDFGGRDFTDRLCAVAEYNHRLLTASGVDHRFTLAEWNPVEGRPLLSELVRERLPWWHRCLVVDRRWHERLSTNPRLQFMEFFAKNAAIRRSTADAILTTNSDVFLSAEVARALVDRAFDDRVVYRAVRIDIDRRTNWRNPREAELADPSRTLRVNDLQPPDYSMAAGDFLLMTPKGWAALGGFNERVRYAKIHKDGQFCLNARLEGYRFESLGRIFHIDHDLSYSNAAAAGFKGSNDAHYGPEWDYRTRYRNAASWGLRAAVDEAADDGIVYVHHPSTHGALLSVVTVPDLTDAAATNAQLATATGQFVAVTTDPALAAFGGTQALTAFLASTDAGLIAPAGGSGDHPTMGRVPYDGTPVVVRRDVIDAHVDFPADAADPVRAFWLRGMEQVSTAEADAPARGSRRGGVPRIDAVAQVAVLQRRGCDVAPSLLERAMAESLSVSRDLPMLVHAWLETISQDRRASCAVVGPDWATPMLLEALESTGRIVAGVFAAWPDEEGTCRWGQHLRPLADVASSFTDYVVAGGDARLPERLAALGCAAPVHLVTGASDLRISAADAELDGLRRAQARDRTSGSVDRVLERLPLLTSLEGERAWVHRYDAAQACERAKRAESALEFYQLVAEGCSDEALAMRALFHTARLLHARGAGAEAASMLAQVLAYNPDHGAARALLDEIAARKLAA
jgi:hypothetical protein